jgi:Ca2+-binding RTX toxin-like protein
MRAELGTESLPQRILPAVTGTFSPAVGILSIFGDTAANSIVVSESGGNIIVMNNGNPVNVTGGVPTTANTAQVRVFGADGNDIIDVSGVNLTYGTQAYKTSVDGGSGNDTIIGSDQRDNILGQNGEDSILGGDGNDNISAGAGNDTADAGDGNDIVSGQGGDDSIIGGSGADSLIGQQGADTIFAVDGEGDWILGDSLDSILFDTGLDTVTGV